MKLTGRSVRRLAMGLAALTLLSGMAAPFVNAGRFAGRIQGALEQGLGRKVDIGKVTFNLFTGPGFTVENVVIHDDPAVGIEPLAYVGEMDARVGLWSLVTGRLEFSTLRLNEPSINLCKPDAGSWNLQSLLARAAAGARSARVDPPALEVRGGRFNFKFGDVKSAYYLANADVDITASPGQAEFRFRGEPARTDRGAQGFGRITGRGRWRPAAQPAFEMELNLERSNIGEIVRLFHGHDVGLHGMVASRARLTGPLEDIQVAGNLEIQDIHRWDLMPQRGQQWPIDYRGRIALDSQVVEIETVPAKGETPPVSARLRASGILTKPRWAAVIGVRDLPVGNLAEVARHFGAALPEAMRLEGSLEGAIGYSAESGVQGLFLARAVTATSPEAGSLRIERARVEVNRDLIRMAPAAVEVAPGRAAQVEAEFRASEQTFDLLAATRGLPVEDLRMVCERMFGVPAMPLLKACEAGQWRGWVRCRREKTKEAEWSAGVELRDLRVAVAGLADPLLIPSASAQIDAGRIWLNKLHGQLGKIAFEGDFRRVANPPRPDRLRVSAGQAELPEVARLLAPTLRRQGGFLARTLRLAGGAPPDWLRERRAEVTVEIGVLSAGGLRWDDVRARLAWNGTAVDIAELSAAWNEGELKAKGSLSLASLPPIYRLEGRLSGFFWRGATIDVDGKMETSGSGADLVENLKSSGTLAALALPLAEDLECPFAKGRYELSFRRGEPRLKLSALEVGLGEEIFQGQGATGADGKVGVDLSDGKKSLRLTGTLSPFAFEATRAAKEP